MAFSAGQIDATALARRLKRIAEEAERVVNAAPPASEWKTSSNGDWKGTGR